MNRVYFRSTDIREREIVIDDREQLHHLKVLRVNPGEEIVAFDEAGNEYACRVAAVDKKRLTLLIEKTLPPAAARVPAIAIAVAIPKQSKIDDIIDKLTQVGCDRVIPLVSERVIARPSEADSSGKQRRWEKIAFNATLQSQRSSAPKIDPPLNFSEMLKKAGEFDLKLIPTLGGARKRLADALSGATPKNILVLIGPEGDFTAEECAAASAAGFIPVSFGANVLRVETAAVYICSVLAYTFRK